MIPESDIKHFGKVYTPRWIVDQMLEALSSSPLEHVHICDPACGSGDFLVPIAKHICGRIRESTSREREGLCATLAGLTGYDIDLNATSVCRQRLSSIVQEGLGEHWDKDQWRILHADALSVWEHDAGTMDWVVGNPPYVRIQNLEQHRRAQIAHGGWEYFHGASDLYIVFFELGLRLLKTQGQLVFISPSGWMRNSAGRKMREDIASQHCLKSIYDFGDTQVFPGVSTYTCITHLAKQSTPQKPSAKRWDGKKFTNSCGVFPPGKRWAILDSPRYHDPGAESVTLGEIADIHVGIQTLADKVFILELIGQDGDLVQVSITGNGFSIEAGAVRRILKASVLRNGRDRLNRVAIYPYDEEGKLIPENMLVSEFPLAYAWLKKNKTVLLSRDKGAIDPDKWYGYGRSVGIRSSLGPKILTSGMNESPNFQVCRDPDTLFYSGYCIKPKINISLDALQSMLNTPRMEKHIKTFSQPFRNGWFSYAKQYIRDFPISEELLVQQIQ